MGVILHFRVHFLRRILFVSDIFFPVCSRTSSLITLFDHFIFSILLQHHISGISKYFRSNFLSVLVSESYKAMLQTRHLSNLFLIDIYYFKKESSQVWYILFQVGSMLITRVANVDITWHKEMVTSPRISHEFDLTLEDKSVLRAIEQLNFIQMKRKLPYHSVLQVTLYHNNSLYMLVYYLLHILIEPSVHYLVYFITLRSCYLTI